MPRFSHLSQLGTYYVNILKFSKDIRNGPKIALRKFRLKNYLNSIVNHRLACNQNSIEHSQFSKERVVYFRAWKEHFNVENLFSIFPRLKCHCHFSARAPIPHRNTTPSSSNSTPITLPPPPIFRTSRAKTGPPSAQDHLSSWSRASPRTTG